MILLVLFVLAERRVSHLLLPLRVIMDRARGGSYISVGLTGIAVFGVFLFLTYYLQQVKGYSPVTSGLAFLPMIACILLASNISSIVLLPRVGPRALIVTGMLLGGGAMVYLTQRDHSQLRRGKSDVLDAEDGPGLRPNRVARPLHGIPTAGLPRKDSGVASALVKTIQHKGASMGTAALSTVALTAQLPTSPRTTAGRWPRPRPRCTATRWPSRCPRHCSASARWWRSCCCRPGAGGQSSGTWPRRPAPRQRLRCRWSPARPSATWPRPPIHADPRGAVSAAAEPR